MANIWIDYIDAAHRKIRIAEFHLGQLNALLNLGQDPFSERPQIPVQAHFEGVVVATGAAIDQVAQAANSAWKLGLKPSDLFNGTSLEIEKRIPDLGLGENSRLAAICENFVDKWFTIAIANPMAN